MSETLLEVDGLDAFYGDFQALFGVSMQVEAGAIVAVIGANGAGKSTLLKSVAGLMDARPNAIRFDAGLRAPGQCRAPRCETPGRRRSRHPRIGSRQVAHPSGRRRS